MRVDASAAAVFAAILACSGPSGLNAQEVPVRSLEEPVAAFPEPFGSIAGLRELPDGRLLVSDGLGGALVAVNLAAGTSDTIGAEGQGPNEYREPDALFPLPGDSTLLVDLGNGRLVALGPDLRFGPTEPIARPDGTGLVFAFPRGTDRAGGVYFQRLGTGQPGGPLPDSAAVVRWDRASGEMREVARVKLQARSRSSSGNASNRSVRIRPRPLTPQDAWAVGEDGRVAVARSADYHLEWILPDGTVVRGPAVSYRPVPVRQADQEEWLETRSSGLSVSVTVQNGERRTAFTRGGSPLGASTIEEYEWPEVKPAFPGGAVVVTPEGEAWVRRHVPAGEPVRYDVFGPDGRLREAVRLPPGRRWAGFGRGVVYLARRDAVDFEWLERYRRP